MNLVEELCNFTNLGYDEKVTISFAYHFSIRITLIYNAGRQKKCPFMHRIDDKEAYSMPFPMEEVKVVGIGYFFKGIGSVRKVLLENSGKIGFRDFA